MPTVLLNNAENLLLGIASSLFYRRSLVVLLEPSGSYNNLTKPKYELPNPLSTRIARVFKLHCEKKLCQVYEYIYVVLTLLRHI